MNTFQLYSCTVALAGSDLTTVVRDHDTAVTYPELLILRHLHGAESVRNVRVAGSVQRDDSEERSRLMDRYTVAVHLFPAAHQMLPTEDPHLAIIAAKEAEAALAAAQRDADRAKAALATAVAEPKPRASKPPATPEPAAAE